MLRATLRSFLAHKGRMLLSALAVVLSVAFVAGSLLLSDTATATFNRLFASTASDVEVAPRDRDAGNVTAPVATLPAGLGERVARVDGVARTHLNVQVQNVALADSRNRSLGPAVGGPTIATNWYVGERNPLEVTAGRPPRGPGEAMLDQDTADQKGVRVGDRLRVLAPRHTFPVRVVGIAAFRTTNPGATLLFLETRTAQRELLGSTRAATTIAVDAAPGVPDQTLKRRVSAALKDTGPYQVHTRDEQRKSATDQLAGFLSIIKYVMVGFAGVAVLVGTFLIVNTFSMLIAQRTRELGLLRALGADRRQVRRSVLVEALLLGLVGATVGLGAGVGLAAGLIALLNAQGLKLNAADLAFRWPTPVAAYAVGVGVTFVAALLPALRAGRVSPMAALAHVEVAGTGRPLRVRTAVGLVMAAAGAAALVGCAFSTRVGPAGGLLVTGIVLTLFSGVVLGPVLVRPVIRVLGRVVVPVSGAVGRLSRRNALRNPRRTGATATALMVGLALVTGLAITGASLAHSAEREVDRTLGADFIVQNPSYLPFSREVADRVRDTDGVRTVVSQRLVSLDLRLPDGDRRKTTGAAFGPGLGSVLKMSYTAGNTASALAPGRVAVDQRFARDHGLRLGGVLRAVLPSGRAARFTVGALTDNAGGSTQGGVIMSQATLEVYQPQAYDSLLLVGATPGADQERVQRALKHTLAPYPQLDVNDRSDYKKLITNQVQGLLRLLYGLLALAVIIAVLGVVNTLTLSVVERTREIGLLRAVGLSRLQTRRMIRLESVVIALFGAVLGLALGLVWGAATQQVLELEGLTSFVIPWTTVVAVVIGSVLVGLLAALLPALRASRMNVLAAVAHE
ncbi:FtsX-like permease family protein [Streptomyces sp. NPDC003077]|uniref:ABC transporter permease n=1 Tax=Streptomyces sp. NPDC003077 TaxID=3154443 RepID=UPI0033BF76B9